MTAASPDILGRLAAAGLSPPKAVTLSVTDRCNLSCRHCWPESGPGSRTPEVPGKRVKAVMADAAALGARQIVVTGGEPLLRPDWEELLAFAGGLPGVGEVRLQTNAILVTPAHVAALLARKARGVVVQVSLEGVRAESHERVRGEGSFERTLAGIRLLVAGGLASRICVTFTEMAHNFDELPDLLAMADGWGVGRFVTGTLVQGGRAAGQSALAPPTPEQYENLLARYRDDAAFRDRYRRIGNVAALEWARGGGDAAPGCCRLVESPYVTAGGRLHPCVMLHADEFAAEGVYDRPLAEVIGENIDSWGRLEALRGLRRDRVAACRDCPHADRCGAGCMGRAFAAYGDAFAVEDRCRLRQAVYRQASFQR